MFDFTPDEFNFGLVLIIVAFGSFALFTEFRLAKMQSWSASDATRLAGLTIVITFTIAVVIGMAMIPETGNLTTALMGFLGTIAGYLAGSKEIISGGKRGSQDENQKIDDETTRGR